MTKKGTKSRIRDFLTFFEIQFTVAPWSLSRFQNSYTEWLPTPWDLSRGLVSKRFRFRDTRRFYSWSKGNTAKSVKINENQWKSMKIIENHWKSMKINENHSKSMKIIGNEWNWWARSVSGAFVSGRREAWVVGQATGHPRDVLDTSRPAQDDPLASTSLQSPTVPGYKKKNMFFVY